MILTQHGINSLKPAVLSPFLFYTDYSHVNTDMEEDTPLIGEPGIYNSGSLYFNGVYSSDGPFNKNYAQIYGSYDFPQMETPYEMTNQVDQLTLELWLRRVDSTGLYFNIPSGGSIFILSNLIHLQFGTGYTCTLYNGTSYHTNTASTIIIKTTDNTSNWVHVAAVNTKGSVDLYTNGVLRAKFVRSTPLELLTNKIALTGNGSRCRTQIAYISVRRGNQSNNNESFTVPTQPYISGGRAS